MPGLPTHLHPMVVHFPIALFITAYLFELIGLTLRKDIFHSAAIIVYVTAALMTPIVVQTGYWEAERVGISHRILDQHRQFALTLMWVSLTSLPVLWLAQAKFKKYFKIVFFAFLVATVIFVSLTADRGGRMVYEYGVGIDQ